MMKKKSHPEFVRALKARNLKITVVGTYENCLSRGCRKMRRMRLGVGAGRG